MGAAEVETTFPEKTLASKKLKLKILTRKPSGNPCEFSKLVPMKKCSATSAQTNHRNTTVSTLKTSFSISGSKRKLEGAAEYQRDKKLKLDCSATSKCLYILRKLMEHKFSSIFSEPVDPYKLGIPDYFEIIKKPMDLGTVKSKLEQNMYMQVEEFESDIRLTFSNATRYNPPSNWVHGVAKELMRRFDNLWKPVKAKLCRQNEGSRQQVVHESIIGTTQDDMGNHFKSLSSNVDKLVEQTVVSTHRAPESLKGASLENVQLKDVKVDKDGKAKGDESSKLCVLDKKSGGAPRMCVESACTVRSVPQNLHAKPVQSARKVTHKNVVSKKATQVELKAVDVKTSVASQPSRSDRDTDGCVSRVDENYDICNSSFGATTDGLDNAVDVQLSPSKALRAAMLKSRFADTILKAQQKKLLQPGDRSDPVKLRQEKERLEQLQHKEKARIEAEIKAAEYRAESELRRKREQDRQAARIALEKMERSVDLDDNFHILRELEGIFGSSPLFLSFPRQGGISRATFEQFENGKLRSPLERLGLFIKAEYMMSDDEDSPQMEDDLEEGEVVF